MARRIVMGFGTRTDPYVICGDGTLWRLTDKGWLHIEGPPEGSIGVKEMTLEEAGRKLAKTGRRLIRNEPE